LPGPRYWPRTRRKERNERNVPQGVDPLRLAATGDDPWAGTMTLTPGLFPNTPADVYHSWAPADYSLLRHFSRSAAHAREELLKPKAQTRSMDLGAAAHTLILEPSMFHDRFALKPDEINRRSKAGKIAWANFERGVGGKTVLDRIAWEQVNAMAEAVRRKYVASTLLYGRGANEVSVIWVDQPTGVWCKARLDRLTDALGFAAIVDYKTSDDAQLSEFERIIFYYKYHVQAALYVDGIASVSPGRRKYLLIVQEKERPYEVAVYELDEVAIDLGRREYREALALLARCHETGEWPGYPDEVRPISLPSWAMKR